MQELLTQPELVNKWVGDTGMNLPHVSHEVRLERTVLLFDEGEALVGERAQLRLGAPSLRRPS
jgi:SpoVK/Ycf46/Vps4 family AAA+-type ATPase